MKTYPKELRVRVIRAYQEKEGTLGEIAKRFQVSRVWVKKVVYRWKKTGSMSPVEFKPGRNPVIEGKTLQRLERTLEKKPDATLEELRELVGVKCSLVTVHNTLKRLGYRRLKKRYAPASRTARM